MTWFQVIYYIHMGEKKKTGESGHQALYRKYRSRTLKEVLGQEHVTKTLENAIKNGKISHAYLFTGPRGTGKTSIARILAHKINNLPYTDDSTHLDIIEIDAASNRRIDDIRDLRDKVHIAPLSAKYKVYIIDEVHMLTNESFNALLKTLEEPPKHVIFFLATTEVHKLPATILSRTQRHSLRLASQETITKHLSSIAKKEGIEFDLNALKLLALHGGGSFRDSVSLLDQLGSSGEKITIELVELLLGVAPESSLKKLLSAAANGESAQIINQVEKLLQSGLTPSGIATQLLSVLRNSAKEESISQATTALMSELLLVQSAQYPQMKLEVALLKFNPLKSRVAQTEQSAATTNSATKSATKIEPRPKPTNNPQTVAPEPKVKEVEPIEKKRSTQKILQKADDFTTETLLEQWPAVLSEAKKKNNSLYTVLRLAAPEVENQELVLFFSFPFHQKKLEEPKNKSVVSTIVQEVCGVEIPITTQIDKSKSRPATDLNTATTNVTDPAHASLISNVQDIMGGGEVVNV